MSEHRLNKERLELALEAAGLDLWENDLLSGDIICRASKVFAELGYGEEEVLSHVDDIFAIMHPDDIPPVRAAIHNHREGKTAQYRCEFRMRAKSGEWIWYANHGRIVETDGERRGKRFVGVTFNIDDRKAKEHELELINRKLTEEVIKRKQTEAKIKRLNRALKVISLCNRVMQRAKNENELLQKMCRIIVGDGGYRFAWVGYMQHDPAKSVRPVASAGFEDGYLDTLHVSWAENAEKGQGPTGIALRSGQPFVMKDALTEAAFAPWREDAIKRGYSSAMIIPLRIEDLVFGISAMRQKIKNRDIEEQLQYLAHYDALTGLPNRALFFDRLQQSLAIAKRDKTKLAIMFIDIDLFKPVNDKLGHGVGDLLLKEIAQRIRDGLRESDSAARYGGDEFVVLLPSIDRPEDAMVVAKKICATLNESFMLANHAIHISASIGIAVYPDNGNGEDALLKSADAAMYEAKSHGRNTVKFSQRSG